MELDLTPGVLVVPHISSWLIGPHVNELYRAENTFAELVREQPFNMLAANTNIYDCQWDESCQIAAKYSYPGRRLLIHDTRENLGWWEVFAIFAQGYAKKIQSKITSKTKSIQVRSFHIHDDKKIGLYMVQKILKRIGSEIGITIKWSWMATQSQYVHRGLDSSRWMTGIDDSNEITAANMRSWKNKLDLNAIEFIFSAAHDSRAIVFALNNLAEGGFALILLSSIGKAASLIHLFACCFRQTKILRPAMNDEIFLLGEDFIGVLGKKQKELLLTYGEGGVFGADYMAGTSFTATMNKLSAFLAALHKSRFEHFQEVVKHSQYLAQHPEEDAEKYLVCQYPDRSVEWISNNRAEFTK